MLLSSVPAETMAEEVTGSQIPAETEDAETQAESESYSPEVMPQKTVPAAGHTEGDAVQENIVSAGCTSEGSYDSVVYCTECGEKLSSTHVIVPAAGHKPKEAVRENEDPATCQKFGSYEEVVYCEVCNTELSRVKKLIEEFADHVQGEPKTENNLPATCTEKGFYDTVVYCTVCNGELSRVQTEVPATGHSFGEYVEAPGEGRPATCIAVGVAVKKSVCSSCGKERYFYEPINALGHDWEEGAEFTDPVPHKVPQNEIYDCWLPGYASATCRRCGYNAEYNYAPLSLYSDIDGITYEHSNRLIRVNNPKLLSLPVCSNPDATINDLFASAYFYAGTYGYNGFVKVEGILTIDGGSAKIMDESNYGQTLWLSGHFKPTHRFYSSYYEESDLTILITIPQP